MKELRRMSYPTQILLRQFTSDELLIELARRESYDGTGGVLFHRVRVILEGEGAPDDIVLYQNADVTISGRTSAVARIEAMIDGEWRSQDWIRDPATTPTQFAIHKGEYD